MKAVLLSLALTTAAISPAAAGPLKLFIFTNEVPSGSVDEQLAVRRESLEDVIKALSSVSYEKTITLVKDREGADVTVELLSRGAKTTSAASSSRRTTDGATATASRSSSVTKEFLKFRISAGSRTHDLTTEAQLPWPKMAELAAEQLVKWIVDNGITARP